MRIEIEGVPLSQIRMKYSSRNGFGQMYDPRQKAKREIKKIIEEKFRGIDKFIHPRVSFLFLMPIPKSLPKKVRLRYLSNLIKHEKKPDVDNFIKLYLDCLDTYAFDGDEKVQLGSCFKLYHSEPKTVIFISESSDSLNPQEIDQALFFYLISKGFDGSKTYEKDCLPDSNVPLPSES